MLESTEMKHYLNPTQDNERYLEEHKDKVLLKILELGVSYPSEIARSTSINIENVNKILSMFLKFGFIKRATPDKYDPQQIFKTRIPEFWAMGMVGHERLLYMSWWTMTAAGIEYIKEKYKGQHKQIRGSLIAYLGLTKEGESND